MVRSARGARLEAIFEAARAESTSILIFWFMIGAGLGYVVRDWERGGVWAEG